MDNKKETFYGLFDLGFRNDIHIKEIFMVDNKMCLRYSFPNKKSDDREIFLESTLTNEEIINKLKETKKPALGITPHFIWIEQRIDEIKQAINRKIEAKENIPHEWYIELAQLENERISNTNHLEIKIPEGSNIGKETADNFIFKSFTACDKCGANPKNGGSGICNCTLNLPIIT